MEKGPTPVSDRLALLAEIDRLIQSAPAASMFYEDIPANHAWLGEVENALRSWDRVESAGVSITIGSIFNLVLRNNGERQALLIKLTQARRSLQMSLGVNARPYVEVSPVVRSDLQRETKALAKAVTESNSVDAESREILLAEIAIFEATIAQPRLSADLIQRFVSVVLKGAALKLAGSGVDQIAERIVTLIAGAVLGHVMAQ
jgi:hypothetical protein